MSVQLTKETKDKVRI